MTTTATVGTFGRVCGRSCRCRYWYVVRLVVVVVGSLLRVVEF
jgi:hypothetical protein